MQELSTKQNDRKKTMLKPWRHAAWILILMVFNPQTIAGDLLEVRRIYNEFFATVESDWDKTVKGGPKEWNLHETVAHQCALNGDGLESIKHTLRGELYTFVGLEDRYKFNDYNRTGINDHLHFTVKELCAEQKVILEEAAYIARSLTPHLQMGVFQFN